MADWLEMELALSNRRSVTDAVVVRIDEVIDDDLDAGLPDWDDDAGEKLDREIMDDKAEKRRDMLWDELNYRQELLGDLYPFVLAQKGATNWELTRRDAVSIEVGLAHHVYIGALVMASFKHGHIKKQPRDGGQWKNLEKKIAGQFQHLAAYAAASLMGEAYSFGWPRPNKAGFRDAAVEAMKCLGWGKVRDTFPLDSTGKEKDGTVDVIAWRAFRDRTFGALVLFGQVASGNNWYGKPIDQYLNEKFLRYLDPAPCTRYIGATFIPFLLHTELAEPTHGDMFGAMAAKAQGLEMSHGAVIDRLRITELLGGGVPDAAQLHNCADPTKTLSALAAWVTQCQAYCDKAA